MFARLAAVSTLAFAVLAAAGDNCNTGPIQCCNHLEDPHSTWGSAMLAKAGIDPQSVTGQIGVECSPITVVGVSGTKTCEASPVCCENNSVNSLISIGCVVVDL